MMETEVVAETRRRVTPTSSHTDRSMIATPSVTNQAMTRSGSRMSAGGVVNLQRLAGNAAVGSLLGGRAAQPSSSRTDAKSEGVIEEEFADRKLPTVQRDDLDPGAKAGGEATTAPTSATDVKVAVALPAAIRDSRSPAGMKDRIAPDVETAVQVTITGGDGKTPVDVSVDGSGGANGTVTTNGGATASLAASANVTLKGTAQTAVGSGGNLKLVAKQGGAVLATSAAFSVSAIPRDYTDTFVSLVTGARRGFVVQDGWKSDSASGSVADLDGAEISEMVEYQLPGTGCFATAAAGANSGYLAANVLSKDTHSRGTAELTKAGVLVANQTCKFNDKRSGSTDIPMQNSGYILTRKVELKPGSPAALQITTSKIGTATTAKTIASAAGVGTIEKTQDV